MSWASALKALPDMGISISTFSHPPIPQHKVDWPRLVSLDFETYYDADYTLSKLSTSEYIRDPRFKAQMLGVKIGNGKTRIIPAGRIKTELAKINWSTHAALCHNTQFDGFILSHHYGVHPAFLYDSLSMARGLHSNDIGAGLDEVAVYYGGCGKIEGSLEKTKGVLNWSKAMFAETGTYCANDVDEMFRIFGLMLPKMPADEIDLIDLTCRMFCSPVLKVDIPRVEKELERELARREVLMYAAVTPADYEDAKLLKGKDKLLEGKERELLLIKKVIGSNELFANLLRAEGVEPPVKISPAWIKKPKDLRDEDGKYAYAFAKDDAKFLELPNRVEDWGLDLNDPAQVKAMTLKQERLQALVDVRIAVKSTTNVTRAERFLIAGANGMSLPIGYAYYRAHTGRWGGQNKMNMQNLTRGGELRLSILAPKGHQLAVVDSGQIEARVNGWLWGQNDLLDAFRDADAGTGRDAYCNFGDHIYGREITKADKMERFVGKVCVLGLGFQMGAPKFQMTLAKGALGGPPVYFALDRCKGIVNTYRVKNYAIVNGWGICKRIIEDMAAGREGSHGPLNWEFETVWLPNGMALKYPGLRKGHNPENGYEEWSYQAKDQRKKIYGGLLCLGASTEVLTDDGWKPIISVRHDDKLWDGTNWVSHSGLVHQGVKETISFGGVDMTPDHEVLVNNRWHAAERTTHHEATSSFARHHRHPFRHAYGNQSSWVRWSQDALDSVLRLRPHEDFRSLRILKGAHKELWVLDDRAYRRVTNDPRHVQAPGLLSLAQYAGPLQTAYASILGALRWARDHGVRGVGRLRHILGGHADWVRSRPGPGPTGQLPGVQPRELPMGDATGEYPEHSSAIADWHANRPYAPLASSRNIRDRENDSALPVHAQLASEQDVRQARRQKQDVFDLADAGPLKRFTVRGDDGLPFVVHNCENVVQALARIIVAWQMLRISRKHRVVMTTHDEVVACIKTGQAQRGFEFMTRCMSTAPAWCPDIPLNCEGGFDVNYSK